MKYIYKYLAVLLTALLLLCLTLPAAAEATPDAVIGELAVVMRQYKTARFLSCGIENCV